MSRIPRKNLETTYFHILVQGINKEYIFNCHDEMKKYENTLFKEKEKFNLKILAYCIMNNHVHLLVKTEKIQDLSKFMHKVNMNYARYFNKKYSRVGHVFRDRFKTEEIRTKEYLYNCINYIHKNPVKAGICNAEEEYPFSSFNKFKAEKDFFSSMSNSEKIFIDMISDMKQSAQELVEVFLSSNRLSKKEMLKNKTKLKELLIILKKKNNLSIEEIRGLLNIGRNTLIKVCKDC